MITVRFPNGFSVQYNDLNFSESTNSGTRLYSKAEKRDRGAGWLVEVRGDCIIEHTSPCRTYNAYEGGLQRKLDLAKKQIERLKKAKEQA